MEKQRIAVLGAGPMGLAVAMELVKMGHQPVVYEADDRVGGMTACFDFEGLMIERYYHFHCTTDKDFLATLDELGIANRMHWKESRMGYFYRGKLNAWGNPVALLKFPGLSLIAKIRYGLHAFLCTKRRDWKPLDKISATEWLRRWVGAEAYEVLWRRLLEYKFYDYAGAISAAWIWSRIRRIGLSRYDLFREKLGYLEGGSDTLLKAMKAFIELKGGVINLSKPASKVVIENGKAAGIMVGGQLERFDKIVSTIPLPYVPRLMPDLPRTVLEKYQAVKNIAVVCVIAKLRKPVSEYFWININDDRMDIPGVVEYSNLRPLDDHVVYVPFYMPGEHPKYQDGDDIFIGKVRTYLKMINPSLTDEDFIAIRASRYRHAQPVCEPGFLAMLPAPDLPVKGLWAADTSYYYPDDRGISESIGFGRKLARMATA